MKHAGHRNEFAEVLREKMQLSSQEFTDLFNTSRSSVSGKPRLKHELTKIKGYVELARSPLLDIKI